MTLNNAYLYTTKTMCLIRSGAPPVWRAHYPAFTNSRILDHNNLTMDSLPSPLRTPPPPPSPCVFHPSSASALPHHTLSSLFSVVSQSTQLWQMVGRYGISPVYCYSPPCKCGSGSRTRLSPLLPSPSPPPSFFAFSSILLYSRIFHSIVKGCNGWSSPECRPHHRTFVTG